MSKQQQRLNKSPELNIPVELKLREKAFFWDV